MEALIGIVNDIQDVAVKTGTVVPELPIIVVQGLQSSGKSSVLEGLVGRSFLPRGPGMVTRCPIVVQMIPIQRGRGLQNGDISEEQNGSGGDEEEWGEFLHNANRRFTNFHEIKQEILAETDRRAGSNKGISHDPITIKIYSTKVVQLTVVDLPGFTKVPVGDQPSDIEKQIRDLVLKYITPPNSIILAVSQANVDFAASESIKLAKRVDPSGSRTLAVVTMLDKVGEGESVLDTLTGGVLAVQLGIIGVVNRSPMDVNSEKPVELALRDEKRFLLGRYPTIAHLHGTERLRKRLHELLIQHIKVCLDDVERSIHDMIADAEIELRKLGSMGSDVKDKRRVVNEVISAYCDALRSEVFGCPRNRRTDRVAGKERLIRLFSTTFCLDLEDIDPVTNITDEDIAIGISRSGPFETIFFTPDGAFRTLIRRPIELLILPAQRCVSVTHQEMKRIINACADDLKSTRRYFPKLNAALVSEATKLLNSQIDKVKDIIETYVDIQADSAFTTDVLFLKEAHALKASMNVTPPLLAECHLSTGPNDPINTPWRQPTNDAPPPNGPPDNAGAPLTNGKVDPSATPAQGDPNDVVVVQQAKCKVVRELMRLYFDIVRKNHQDFIPKALLHTVIYYTVEHLATELATLLGEQKELEELVEPPTEVVEKQQNTMANLEALKRTAKAIPKLRLI